MVACPECHKEFPSAQHLQWHKKRHSPLRNFPCTECDRKFRNTKDLNAHRVTHFDDRPFACDQCDVTFKTAATRDQHVRNIHVEPDARPFTCDECQGVFKTKAVLKTHQERIHQRGDPIPCPYCAVEFATDAYLEHHINRAHRCGDDEHPCTECDKVFDYKYNLAKHIASVHKEKRFKCQFCDLRFEQPGQVRAHEGVHTGVLIEACSQCDARFCWKSSLRVHVYYHHTIEGQSELKREEMKIVKLLDEKYGKEFYKREHVIDYSCIKEGSYSRVDFLIPYRGKVHCILEVDERQHSTYSQMCETARMNNIVSSLRLEGNETPIVFIRYNPHAFKVNGRTRITKITERHQTLVELLETIRNSEPVQDVAIHYLFYDEDDGVPSILRSPDYFEDIKSWVVLK